MGQTRTDLGDTWESGQNDSSSQKGENNTNVMQHVQLHPRLHHPASRDWQEPQLNSSQLVFPLFVTLEDGDKDIKGFAPNKQWGAGTNKEYDSLCKYLNELQGNDGSGKYRGKLRSVMLFGVVKEKDEAGTRGDATDNPVVLCLKALKKKCPELMLMADVCLCEYTDHGHCGIPHYLPDEKDPVIVNESTLGRLVSCAVAYAEAGAHYVCPSDMMDGRIGRIREALNKAGKHHVGVMSYTSKKASSLYSPFRAAVESTFKGDRKRYQQPIGSSEIALRSFQRDVAEGADVCLVKPSLFYSDIIKTFKEQGVCPVAAYLVSGEYKMLYDYGNNCGCFDEIVREAHISLLRAGATILVTYFTPFLLEELAA